MLGAGLRPLLRRNRLLLLHETHAPDWQVFAGVLDRHDIAIATILDVGVASGTPDLYEAWPKAKLYLFDPTAASLPHMQAIAAGRRAEIFNLALGDRDGTIELHEAAVHASSTVLAEKSGGGAVARPVRMARFDDLVTSFARPALCKIDVQGAELIVLRGMERAMPNIDVFVLEMSIRGSAAAPDFHALHTFMVEHGFALHDIVGMLRRPYDNSLGHIDGVYVRRDSPLRATGRWS
jgi:FkbM family methyltransferase